MNYWLVKSDPETYGWKEFSKEKKTDWTGVRAYPARNHMKAMKKGDLILFYHSQGSQSIVGLAKVTKEFFRDPTADDDAWVAVEIAAGKEFMEPVTLSDIKKTKELKDMALLKISRLSVMPVTQPEFEKILEMGKTKV
jgi:predicted RNA-binding protein with PUA-like domain